MCIEVCEIRLSRIVHFGGGGKKGLKLKWETESAKVVVRAGVRFASTSSARGPLAS